jgi:indole-3-glycerol phosphate synthase
VLFVAESGIRSPEDVSLLCEAGVDAVLIGEALMRSANINASLSALKAGGKPCPK